MEDDTEVDVQIQIDKSGETTIHWLNIYVGGDVESVVLSKKKAERLIEMGVSHLS